jgi:hypothetical protein
MDIMLNRYEWSFSSVDYLGDPSFVHSFARPLVNDTFYRGLPYPTVFLTATSSVYTRYDDKRNSNAKLGILQEFESLSIGSQLNATNFGIVLCSVSLPPLGSSFAEHPSNIGLK